MRGELVRDEGGSIVLELCVWHISRPSLLRFTIRSRSSSRLIITAVYGEGVSKELAEGTLDIEIRSDILFQWRNAGNAIDSFAIFRVAQRNNSSPFTSNFSRIFNLSREVEYFAAIAARSGRDYGDDDDYESGSSIVPLLITIFIHLLVIACICGCCAVKRRAQRRDRQVPSTTSTRMQCRPYFSNFGIHLSVQQIVGQTSAFFHSKHSGGGRPYGTALLFGGYNGRRQLYALEPSGQYFGCFGQEGSLGRAELQRTEWGTKTVLEAVPLVADVIKALPHQQNKK